MDWGTTELKERDNFLDCLRAIAAFLVLAVHAGLLLGGGIGVSIFFCLSGYLITTILLRIDTSSPANIGRIIFRRFMRIWPMMFVQIVAVTILTAIEAPELLADYLRSVPGLLTFTSPANLSYQLSRSILWTLQAEFWFYVFLGVAFLIFGRRSLLAFAFVGITFAWGAKLGFVNLSVYLPMRATILYLDQLMIGVVCAVAVQHDSKRLRRFLGSRSLFLWTPLALITVLSTLKFVGYDRPWFFSSSAAAYLTALMILHQWARPLKGDYEPIATLGRISYSIYLMHGVVYDFVSWHIFPHALQFLFHVGIIILISKVTYRWIELPFVRWSKMAPLKYPG